MNDILNAIQNIGIVPVVKIQKTEDILPMAHALNEGGINCMEITFRSEFAVQAIHEIRNAYPDMIIGAGTVTSVDYAQQALEAGAQFLVTPGFNPDVVKWAVDHNILIVPGVQTASEIEAAMAFGLTTLKFFPAESSGGVKKLKDFSGPYSHIKFMPSGGINKSNMHNYLDLPNVAAIGGSFMLPNDLIAAGDWDGIETLSKEAIKFMLEYKLMHIGVNSESKEQAQKLAQDLATFFNFKFYETAVGSKSDAGFEFLHTPNENLGYFGIQTCYPERALYQLAKQGIHANEATIARNKAQAITSVALNRDIAGFNIRLVKSEI